MSESSSEEKALNGTQVGTQKTEPNSTHMCRRTGLIGSADKSQARRITQEERLSFRPSPLPAARVPFRCLCVCGDSKKKKKNTIAKPLSNNNNPLLRITLLELRLSKHSCIRNVITYFLFLVWGGCSMTKKGPHNISAMPQSWRLNVKSCTHSNRAVRKTQK